MIMITIVICLALEFFTSHLTGFRSYRWADPYARFVKSLFRGHDFWNGPGGVLAVLVAPVFLAATIQNGLKGVWLGVFELAFSIIVLVYCLRYQPRDEWVDELSDALDQDNHEHISRLAENILGKSPDMEMCLVKQVSSAILVNVNERLFAVMFWFVILGPMGALMYRLTWYYSELFEDDNLKSNGFQQTMHRLYSILNWLPARLLVIGYAITGSFEDAIHGWREVYEHEPDDIEKLNQEIIASAGGGAIHLDRYLHEAENGEEPDGYHVSAIKAARGLVLRTMLAWGIVIAVITLSGWAS
ncbi:MAG TPA: hypothetical protein ENI65_10170 [Gammaproteobacteria bacterium]|nr:hypothetical protein [Gammaproteobacteria bacterium]